MTKKCIGCGSIMQSNDKDKPGYIKEEVYDKSLYCQRCFRLKNYNEYKEIELKDINNKILDKINKEKYLTFFLIDFLNINSETINMFKNIKSDKILVISKKDIIPNSIKETKITNYIRSNYNIKEDIIYLSSRKKINTSKIINITKEHSNIAYIVGYTNSGKSTLINSITSKINNTSNITTSSIPNTTIDYITINIDGVTLIDTPGFNLENNIYDNNDYDLIRRVNPKIFIKPLTYQTKENTSFIIENKMYISTNNINSVTFYISNNLKIDKLYNKDILNNKEELNIKINDNSDVVLKGIGFINIKKKCNLTIRGNYNNLVEVRPSIFKKDE